MVDDSTDVSSLALEKVEKHLGANFIDLILRFPNEFGPQGVVNLEYLAGIEDLYGEYSEMTPYLRKMRLAHERGFRSASSIGGGFLSALLVKKMMVHQTGVITEQPDKKGGLGFFGGGDDKKKKESEQMQRGFG